MHERRKLKQEKNKNNKWIIKRTMENRREARHDLFHINMEVLLLWSTLESALRKGVVNFPCNFPHI